MMRRFVTILLLAAVPGLAAALGLGKIELNSGLNLPFDARIELLSPTAEEIQTLKVDLADSDAFRRAGIDRPFLLSKLRFEVEVNDSGADYIHITSDDPIREPFLNFLVEANWSSGRLFREYTVLLDPPMYDPNAGRMAREPDTATRGVTVEPEPVREEPRGTEPAATAAPSTVARDYSGGDYGPTVSNDTLWSIAKAVRPNDISIQQMMLALLRANPEAFIDNNVNGLRRGHVLRMPDEAEINRLNRDEAMDEVKSQYALWDEARGLMADRTAERPVGTPDTGDGRETTAAGTDESELRLVTPEEGTGAGQADAAGTELRNELALANEQLESLSSENRELQDRLTEAETIIDDLQRLIALKDDELAALQQQLAAAEDTEAAAPEEEMAAEPEPGVDEAAAGDTEEATPQEEPEPAPEAQEEPAPAPAGILDTARRVVMDNLMILAAGIGLVVLVILALVMIRRRSTEGPEPEENSALAGGFPDFDESADSEASTEIPAGTEDETDFGVGSSSGIGEEVDLQATSEDETVIAAAGEEEAEETAAPAAEEPEESGEEEEEDDPLAEVNVFLAYEHFEQAEEFVRDAINEQPDNLEFHSKLLEVFYASGDKTKYEEEARVLHDMVNGEGEYWDMALAMWQEMSPNRALFEEPAEGEEDSRADTTGGGIVDLTSDVSSESEAGLDFDLGEESSEEAPSSGEDDDEVLDITAREKEEGSLEQTVSESGDEDILDVTAAVGLDFDDDEDDQKSTGDDEDYLDTGGEEPAGKEDDLLDVSADGSSEDLLDVTTHSEMESNEIEEDLLDVTSATGAGADSDELLGVEAESESPGDAPTESDDNSLDFDIGGLEADSGETGGDTGEKAEVTDEMKDEYDDALDFDLDMGESDNSGEQEEKNSGDAHSGSDNVIDFDSASGGDEEDSGLELDLESDDSGSPGGNADLSLDDDNDQELSFSMDEDDNQEGGLSLDMGEESEASASSDDQGLDLDFTLDGDEKDELLESSGEDAGEQDAGLSLDISSDEDESSSDEVPEIDMESTVELPVADSDTEDTIELTSHGLDEGDEDDEDSTVFVPRSSETDEQSSDDEIATRLDLAKAYVELGDKDSAKPILEDIIAEGNDEQRRQAQEMMDQLS